MANFFLKRSAVANKRPDPALLADGELALNTNTASPGIFFKDAGGALSKAGPVHVGTTAPNATPAGFAGNSLGEMWLDTTQNSLKTFTGANGWVGVPMNPALPFDLLPSTTGVHIYSTQKQLTNTSSPLAFSFDTQLGDRNLIPVPLWTSKPWTNALIWTSNNSANTGSWYATMTRWYDQVGTRHLQGDTTETDGPPVLYSLYGGDCGGAYAPTALTDYQGRVMLDGTTVTRQDGNACWVMAVFSGEAGRVPNNGYICEFGPAINNFVGGKSLQIIRNGANNTVFARCNGTSVDLQIAYSTGNKNVILYCDRGPGTNIQYSVNGGALTNGPLSFNTGYQNGCFAVGGPIVTGTSFVPQQWNAPIATVAWWVGAPVDMPTNALLKQISDQLWVS
jgi:hypothetical protein